MMTTNRKLILGGLGLVVLIMVCCFGLILGKALSRKQAPPTVLVAATATVTLSSSTDEILTTGSPEPAATSEPATEPTPTSTLVVDPIEEATATATPVTIVVTATPAPAEPLPPPSPTPVPVIQPDETASDFQALVDYAEAIKPIIDEGLAAAERDGDILEASKQNPEALCGGAGSPQPTLAGDAVRMEDLADRLKRITPPAEADQAIHKPLLESIRLWGEALDNINQSCQTGDQLAQGLMRLEAVVQLGGAMLNFRVASDNFWRLVLINGLEEVIGQAPHR